MVAENVRKVMVQDKWGTPIESYTIANDGVGGQNAISVLDFSYTFNGATWDKVRNNTQGTLLASATRTANVISNTITNYNAKGIQVLVKVTAASGTGGLTTWIIGVGQSGNSYQINSNPTAITGTGVYVYELYPGVSGTSGVVFHTNGALPRQFYISMGCADASSYTYSVEYSLIL